jgi:hypothetical protein
MRAVLLSASVVALVGLSGRVRGAPPLRPPIGEERSCEDECKAQLARADATCEERSHEDDERRMCREMRRARLDVCLRLCEE